MQNFFVLIFYCTFHEILLLLIVKGGVINFDALHQLLYLSSSDPGGGWGAVGGGGRGWGWGVWLASSGPGV